jgi:hypothetical protein
VRVWTKSACAVLAWSILLILVVAAGLTGSARPDQADIRTASITQVTLTGMLGAAAAPAPGPGRRPFPPSPTPAGDRHPPVTVATRAPAPVGLPSWLKTLLLAIGLFAGAGFLAEPILLISRRRRAAAPAGPGRKPGPARPGGQQARIILADYDRTVVTCSKRDGTVYVLRPPGTDPRAILQVARLVLPEAPYEELADHLGVPASWPMEHRYGGPPG